MHIEAMPYAVQLRIHADRIDDGTMNHAWSPETPIHLEISIIYAAVIIRKLWEHYSSLYREVGFDLGDSMPGLHETSGLGPQSGLTFVHRVIHSKYIDTSEGTKASGVEFESDKAGHLRISYADITKFLRQAAAATEAIHG